MSQIIFERDGELFPAEFRDDEFFVQYYDYNVHRSGGGNRVERIAIVVTPDTGVIHRENPAQFVAGHQITPGLTILKVQFRQVQEDYVYVAYFDQLEQPTNTNINIE